MRHYTCRPPPAMALISALLPWEPFSSISKRLMLPRGGADGSHPSHHHTQKTHTSRTHTHTHTHTQTYTHTHTQTSIHTHTHTHSHTHTHRYTQLYVKMLKHYPHREHNGTNPED